MPDETPEKILRAFSSAYLTFARGEQVVKRGMIKKANRGRVWTSHPVLNESLSDRINKELDALMSKWFAHSFENYPVPERYRYHLEQKIEVDATAIPT